MDEMNYEASVYVSGLGLMIKARGFSLECRKTILVVRVAHTHTNTLLQFMLQRRDGYDTWAILTSMARLLHLTKTDDKLCGLSSISRQETTTLSKFCRHPQDTATTGMMKRS